MSASQASGGYPPPQTYPPPYGQPQYPAQGQAAGYPQAYPQQQQYPSYPQQTPAAAPTPAPSRGGGGLMKIMAILTLVGLVIAGVGFLIIGLGVEGYAHCVNSPGACTAQQQVSSANSVLNDTGLGFVLAGVGLLISGIGFGLIFLGLPKKLEELAPKQ